MQRSVSEDGLASASCLQYTGLALECVAIGVLPGAWRGVAGCGGMRRGAVGVACGGASGDHQDVGLSWPSHQRAVFSVHTQGRYANKAMIISPQDYCLVRGLFKTELHQSRAVRTVCLRRVEVERGWGSSSIAVPAG